MHYCVFVVVPKNTQDIEEQIDKQLAPFSEHLDVEPYKTSCYCVTTQLDKAVDAAAEALGLDWKSIHAKNDAYRKELVQTYRLEPPSDFDLLREPDTETEDMKIASNLYDEFRSNLMDQRNEFLAKTYKSLSLDYPAKPDCSSCKGTGMEEHTYNPLGKWDWYQIGGRWTGLLSGYDPDKDPENIEVCTLCNGTGTRTDMVVQNGCDGCSGTGKSVKWPTQWKLHPGDIQPVSAVLKDFKSTYALVLPDGRWLSTERSDCPGWVEKKRDAWVAEEKAALADFPDDLVVVVDIHS